MELLQASAEGDQVDLATFVGEPLGQWAEAGGQVIWFPIPREDSAGVARWPLTAEIIQTSVFSIGGTDLHQDP
jgi:hypothetical protein